MKKSRLLVTLVVTVCMILCVGCGSFDTSGYVKAVLDNSIKGDSSALVEFTKSSPEEVIAVYDQQIQTNLDSLLSGISLDDSLTEKYRAFVISMLGNTKYEVGETTKNSDGSYAVSVKTYALQIDASDTIAQKTTEYINELQEIAANGSEIPSQEEIMAETYRITLECLNDALANATYGAPEDNTVNVSIENKLYTPKQSDLDALSEKLIEVK